MDRIRQFAHDVKNLGIIGISALCGLVVTGLVLRSGASRGVEVVVRTHTVRVHEVLHPAGSDGADRLFGTVTTRDGGRHTGYLLWDRNESSWADLLEAVKPGGRRVSSGLRFGHVARIEPTGPESARLTLRSGEEIGLLADRTDLGSNLRGLEIEGGDPGARVVLEWADIAAVEFQPAPEDAPEVVGRRLAGTVVTSSGLEFGGHIAWDIDESLTTDVLDGRSPDGGDYEIAFGNIASIVREGSGARVTLRDGRLLTLRGSTDVTSSNGGISISDPALGQVVVPWNRFVEARFEETGALAARADFDGGGPIRAEVETLAGEVVEGTLAWDRDETRSWEVLDGEAAGLDFQIEFSQIARISPTGDGAEVELRDGRLFRLGGSNDVDRSNAGVVVLNGPSERAFDFEDIREVRFLRD